MFELKKIPSGKEVWVTSDTHYNHKNICRGVTKWRTVDGGIPIRDTRDFPNLSIMNKTIVDNINGVVNDDDILFHLGDWSFGGFDTIVDFRKLLRCKNVYFLIGNHDHHILKNKENVREIFSGVDHLAYNINYLGKSFFFCHYPVSSWLHIHKGVIHLHGHTHRMGDFRFGVGKRMDVGIDGHPEFRPYNVRDEILPIMESRDVDYEMSDHHNELGRK